MEITAVAKNIRISSRKLKPIVLMIKKMEPKSALSTLLLINKAASKPLAKVIKSAIANAKHNFGLKEENLKFKKIEIGKGMMLKRYRAIGRGRVHQILKRTANIKVVLEEKEEKADQQKVEMPKAENQKKDVKNKNEKSKSKY